MVIDILRKTSETIIFDSDYYDLKIRDITLQNFYNKIYLQNPDAIKCLIKNFVSTAMKPKKESHDEVYDEELLKEFHENGLNQLSFAIEKFFNNEVCNWEIIDNNNLTKRLVTYNYEEE